MHSEKLSATIRCKFSVMAHGTFQCGVGYLRSTQSKLVIKFRIIHKLRVQMLFGCSLFLLAPVVSAGLFSFLPSVPNPLSQVKPPRIDERALSKEAQIVLNGVSLASISNDNFAHLRSIPIGFIPEPFSSAVGEAAATAVDTKLKFTKAVLFAPGDVSVYPDTTITDPGDTEYTNGIDVCKFRLTLPQTKADYTNFLGLWEKFGDDALFNLFDEPINFGALNVPIVYHANTDVIVSVNGPSAGILRDGGVDNGYGQQIVDVGIGTHSLEWRAETQYRPVWDTLVPAATIPIMLGMEVKFSKYIAKLTKWRGGALELASTVNDPDAVFKLVKQLDRRIKFVKLIHKAAEKSLKGSLTSVEKVTTAIVNSVTTVQRQRDQLFTVYDYVPPHISPAHANLDFEATDVGGARSSRYLKAMKNALTYGDNCDREVVLTHNAPQKFPLGDTLVTWTIADLGPAPPGPHADKTNEADNHYTRTATQTITVADTQPPLMVAPPGLVVEKNTAINLNNYDLGQPLIVDLVDLHPAVLSTTDGDGTVTPGKRAIVTWSATDFSANKSTARQLVTVKTPGSNTVPSADNKAVATITSKPVDILLTANDTDVLPFMNGDPGIADPLQFKIEQQPQNGEFVAPLLPFFINDYRTDTTGVLTDDLAFALSLNQFNWLRTEYCDKGLEVPINFIFNPLFVHVTDAGEQYFLDHYAVCDPNGNGDTPMAVYERISRWSKDRSFIGHRKYNPSEGTHNSSFVFDKNGKIYYLLSFGVNDYSLQVLNSDFTGTSSTASMNSYNFEAANGFDISRSTYARVDSGSSTNSSDPIIYLTDQHKVAVYRGQTYLGALANNAGNESFLTGIAGPCTPFPGGGSNQAYGMEVDSQGNFYIADTCGHRIHKFAPSTLDASNNFVVGEYIGWMGKCTNTTNLACDIDRQMSKGFSCTDATCGGLASGKGVGQFNHPVYMSMDPNDVLYVADYTNQRIQRFAPDGTFAGQAKSTGNGINAEADGAFVLGNMGPPRHVSVNSTQFFVVDQTEKFVHVFKTLPFKDITDNSATVTYVSNFTFHTDTDSFTYSVNDGLVDSNIAQVSIDVARNYRHPVPAEFSQTVNVNEDGKVVIVLSASDADGLLGKDFNGLDTLSFVISRQPEHGKIVSGGDAGVTPELGMSVWTYIPDQDFHGSDDFGFSVRDQFTDETFDGTIEIPSPYGETEPVNVAINIASVNDMPIVDVTPPGRIAAGFPVMLQASLQDDTGKDYLLRLDWGDGFIERNGEVIINDNGTPNNSLDDEASLTGISFSSEGLASIGKTPANAMHIYTQTGQRNIQLCMKDEWRLEACVRLAVEVEQLALLTTEVLVPEGLVTDGNQFNATIKVHNAKPMNGVAGLDAENVQLKMDVPSELSVDTISASQGSCSVTESVLNCDFVKLTNASTAIVNLHFTGQDTLLAYKDVLLVAAVTTDTAALADEFAGSASFNLAANTSDSNGNGLSSIFELVYGVSDPVADADNDGLNNLTEFHAGTSPTASDTDGDGINDKDELTLYHTDPLYIDSDDDGLSDGDEINLHASNPNSSDSDGDGLPDQWEIDHGFNLNQIDSNTDIDGDGLNEEQEYQQGTDYLLADSDSDGIDDGDEINIYFTSPVVADSDNDGLLDGAELSKLTDPLKPDTDMDGLKDGAEVNDYFTNPLVLDTDRDGLPDGWETRNNRDPLSADYRIAAGGYSSCALTDAGVECWGRNNVGQAPSLVSGLVKPLDVQVSVDHACALDEVQNGSNSVKCWGSNTDGESTPPPLINPLQISTGDRHSCALDQISPTEVKVKCWGLDVNSQVSGIPSDLQNPVRLATSNNGNYSCVIDNTTSGVKLKCWGLFNNVNTPAIPTTLSSNDVVLDLGRWHGCVVDNGQQLCWGDNSSGQAPVGLLSSQSVQLSLGAFHSCSLQDRSLIFLPDDSYTVECWGRNDYGQVNVTGSLVQPRSLAAGSFHQCAFDQGSAKCWGDNSFMQAPASKILDIDPDGDGLPTSTEIRWGTDPLDKDTDRDGLSDFRESQLEMNALNPDSDGDGLNDGDEINIYNTDPNKADTDNDGMPDKWEIDHALLAKIVDKDGDADSDGLTNLQEFSNETNPSRADTDDDGISDAEELVIGSSPNKADTDGDGAYDGWEQSHGLNLLDASDGELDNDVDGLSNTDEFLADTDPNKSDSDADGMPDGWEVRYGLDPLLDDSLGDIDADGFNNLAEYQVNLIPQIDDVPPIMAIPDDVTVNSTGILTAVSFGLASAADTRSGAVITSVNYAGPFVPGRNIVTWSASDLLGNTIQAEQNINVTPLVNFYIDQAVTEGTSAQVVIQLNGSAVDYPVNIDYTVTGTAINPEDHNASNGRVSIDQGTMVSIPIDIVEDVMPEDEEYLTLTMNAVNNAVPGVKDSHTLNIIEKNIIPTVTIVATQQGKTVTTVAVDGGPVTISAQIVDPNATDTHSLDWSDSNSGVSDPADYTDASYSIDPLSLAEGIYKIIVNIADDGSPIKANRGESMIRVVATTSILSAITDSDSNGVNDLDEGFGDKDNDRVADYLDANDAGNVVLLSSDGYMLETQTGLSLRLGNRAFAAGQTAELLESLIEEEANYVYLNGVIDFEIHGVNAGESVMVVIPLHHAIGANNQYRQFINGGWQKFIEDSNNRVYSAPGGNGACPAPGDASYVSGLQQGNSCIQLLLQDGGANDADGYANGVISELGGIAVTANVSVEILPVNDQAVAANSKNITVLALRFTSDSGDFEFNALTLQASGDGDDRQISNVNLVVDANSNGMVDDGEASIGSGTFNQDNGSLTMHTTVPYALPAGQTDVLVTYDF